MTHAQAQTRGRTSATGGPDRGSSTIEAIIIVPVFIVATLLVVHLGLGWLAANVAQAAARQGLHTASTYTGGDEQGRQDALAYLNAVAPALLPDPQVNVTRTPTTVTVSVRGPVLALLPWPANRVDAHASGPVERFVSGT